MAHFPLPRPSEIQLQATLVWLLSEMLPNQLVAVGHQLVTHNVHRKMNIPDVLRCSLHAEAYSFVLKYT